MDHDRRGHNMSTRQSNGNTTSLTIASNNSLHGSRTSIYRSVNCVLEMEPSISPTNDENSQTNELLSKILRILKKIDGRFSEKKKTEDRRNEWQLVAMVIDRLFMWIFLCATVTMTMCIFGKVLWKEKMFNITQIFGELWQQRNLQTLICCTTWSTADYHIVPVKSGHASRVDTR